MILACSGFCIFSAMVFNKIIRLCILQLKKHHPPPTLDPFAYQSHFLSPYIMQISLQNNKEFSSEIFVCYQKHENICAWTSAIFWRQEKKNWGKKPSKEKHRRLAKAVNTCNLYSPHKIKYLVANYYLLISL